MNDPEAIAARLDDLVARLGFRSGDAKWLYGEVHGSPVTMMVLGVAPLSVLCAFKIAPTHPATMTLPEPIACLVEEGSAEVSLEHGVAWLSFDNLDDESPEEIQGLLDVFGASLSEAGIAVAPGCVSCGRQDEIDLVFVDGRCSRLCSFCLQRFLEKKEAAEQQVNRPSMLHAMGLPLALLYVSGGWLVFWFAIDAILENVIVIDGTPGILVVAAILGALGFGLGYPLGAFLRKGGVARKFPVLGSSATVVGACVLGEILYIAVVVSRIAGIFDLALAARLFLPFVRGYTPGWIAAKLVTAGALILGAYTAAAKKPTVSVSL